MNEIAAPILILGATSDIGRALAHEYARRGLALRLAARDGERLAADARDLEQRYGVGVSTHTLEVLDAADHDRLLAELDPLPPTTVCVIGAMEPQETLEHDLELADRVMRINFNAPARLLARIASEYERRGSGSIVAISSVAGDRGRATNYVYGAAKAGFTAFLSGLRNRLSGRGVHVMTVKPGFVRTRMTEGMDLPDALTASPGRLAREILRAQQQRRDVIYRLRAWRPIMWIIRALPERIFKRLSL